jgi:hypothetical protein
MVNVFISYRRDDSAGYSGRLADALENRLGKDAVFRDVEDIKPGEDFVKAIERNLQNASAFLVIMGKDWLTVKDNQGRRRLDNPNDYVRIEIESALRLKGLIIPVLVEGAVMPKPEELPPSITAIANLQAIEMTDSRWDEDIDRLIDTFNAFPDERARDKSLSSKHKWLRRITLSSALILITGILIFIFQTYFLIPDVSGNWYFERGDYLLIKQDGNQVEIEHIDPEMQTTYEKGNGVIKGHHLEFDLEQIYSQQYRYRGSLELSWNNEKLRGHFLEVLSNEKIPIVLNREIHQLNKTNDQE